MPNMASFVGQLYMDIFKINTSENAGSSISQKNKQACVREGLSGEIKTANELNEIHSGLCLCAGQFVLRWLFLTKPQILFVFYLLSHSSIRELLLHEFRKGN
jgi:hypothetical protein